jgi:hypothetical protein
MPATTAQLARLSCLFLLAASGCASVDQFSSRALSYNDQAETIKEQQFMVNIMRAAYREPLQFSDFTQVTGQAAISGAAAFSLPFSTFPANLSKTFSAAPTATLSGNQSFTIDNLNTQEFYQGILAPIPMSIIDYYMQAEYPKALLLTLFVQRIELKPEPAGGPPIIYDNSYVNNNYQRFEGVLQAAIDLGLTTETVNVMQPIGPPMTAAQLSDLRYLTALGTTGVKLKTYEFNSGASTPPDPTLNAAQIAQFNAQHVTEYYRLVTLAQKAHFCFERAQRGQGMTPSAINLANDALKANDALPAGMKLDDINIPDSADCGAAANIAAATDNTDSDAQNAGRMVEFTVQSANAATPGAHKFAIEISTRSVEGIMYYLGEWVRAEQHIDPTDTPPPPTVETGRGTDQLFAISKTCRNDVPDITAAYDGADYCLAVDPTGQDRSAQVMEIVSQLFALNNSAKDLPSSSLISVLSP